MTQIYNNLVSMKHLVLDRGNWLRIATWLEINEMIDWKTIYQSPFKQANKGPTCWVWSIFSGPADVPRTSARIKNWVMIKHEFMKNIFIPKRYFAQSALVSTRSLVVSVFLPNISFGYVVNLVIYCVVCRRKSQPHCFHKAKIYKHELK